MEAECQVCHQRFARREHLERHLRRHSGIRPFPCPSCSRSFSRRDTLARHVTTHGTGADGLLVRTRGANACLPCSRAKLKCSGGAPCHRCQSKGRNCVYRGSDKPPETALVSPNGANNFAPRSIIGNDTTALGHLPPNPQYNPVYMPSGRDDMTSIPASDSAVPMSPDIDLGFPWMLDYATLFQGGSLGDQQPLLDLATQLPDGPLASTSSLADVQSHNIDIPVVSNQQEHYQSRVLNPNRASIMDATDDDIIIAENFCHAIVPLNRSYQAIFGLFKSQLDVRFKDFSFPSQPAFKSFIQLYYEYFDCQLSFVHRSVLEEQDTPWILVLAVASVGCQYTQLAKREQYSAILTELLRLSLPLDTPMETPLIKLQGPKARIYDTVVLAQCSLLAIVNFMFTGFKDNVVNLQIQRAWLATLVRPFLTSPKPKSSLLSQEVNGRTSSNTWGSWIRSEMERRLAYCYLVVDSWCFIFLGLPVTFTAKDYQQMLPSSDILWGAHNADEWSGHMALDGPQPKSLKELFTMDSAASIASASQTSEFAKLCQHLMLFVEERRVIAANQSCILHDFSDDTQHRNPCSQQSAYSSLDWRYRMLMPSSPTASLGKGVSDTRDTFFHLLFILRHIPLESLYTYSGWYASKEDISGAELYLRTWLQDNPALSRECVSHAGALIGKIRLSLTMSCYDPFCLLIAVLFLWTFEKLKPALPAALRQASPGSGPAIIFKIDQCHEEGIRERWIRGDPEVSVHITGVGLLSSAGGTRRLLQEYLRIISPQTGWPTLRRGLIACGCDLINEIAPITTSPHRDNET
ncbi:hypothetical protein BDV27DRAFT_147175 [Aspergillus caelatus]|uniref:Fungal-specific transcription factor domain-containing protein n=1 Tax=Aspergillus caelatus TaxID=61420 RepID=A0A5N6ZX69_9EURO|nr:uncharacterized protein BDV27DRAFT_147175 [Aspergillus caelatus]KAE8362187.1 hypothetical protein BDV27DRAFT_147175 [Aspergillus caelatus]